MKRGVLNLISLSWVSKEWKAIDANGFYAPWVSYFKIAIFSIVSGLFIAEKAIYLFLFLSTVNFIIHDLKTIFYTLKINKHTYHCNYINLSIYDKIEKTLNIFYNTKRIKLSALAGQHESMVNTLKSASDDSIDTRKLIFYILKNGYPVHSEYIPESSSYKLYYGKPVNKDGAMKDVLSWCFKQVFPDATIMTREVILSGN